MASADDISDVASAALNDGTSFHTSSVTGFGAGFFEASAVVIKAKDQLAF